MLTVILYFSVSILPIWDARVLVDGLLGNTLSARSSLSRPAIAFSNVMSRQGYMLTKKQTSPQYLIMIYTSLSGNLPIFVIIL